MSYPVGAFPFTVSANVPMYDILPASSWQTPAGGYGFELGDLVVKIKTLTPGLGTLLVTLRYDDGEGPQDLNVSLNLTVGNYAVANWPDLFRDVSVPLQIQFTYLAGIVSGTATVDVLLRQH